MAAGEAGPAGGSLDGGGDPSVGAARVYTYTYPIKRLVKRNRELKGEYRLDVVKTIGPIKKE
ncbi:hypothetical protein Dda_6921 [Drechslerella dactyloides]|uniref:Uncharacterized protein n=1 Tax=Drechslerella dactyloides TaxID=74499 RepID=A0AAD6NH30_DREDA|nr:hypothetical protein Dda_6921 [Drechslerella dactyloides]